MEQNKTIYLLSLYEHDNGVTPQKYLVDKTDQFVEACFDQEASLKTVLSTTKIDRLALGVSKKDFDSFKDKVFLLKDFVNDSDSFAVKFINEIKDFINKAPTNNASSINAKKENIDMEVVVNLYGDSEGQTINAVMIRNNMQKLLEIAEHIDVYYDAKGFLSNDYHFLTNFLQIIDDDTSHFSLLGVLNVKRSSVLECPVVVNTNHMPDTTTILSFIKAYASTTKLMPLKNLKRYLENKNIPTKFLDYYISALSFIESGVGLCNIATLKYGINILKKVHEMTIDTGENENAEVVLNIFRNMIDDKFGSLINTDKLYVSNLIDWCIANDYFQQTLTIIESLVPAEMVEKGLIYYAKNKDEAAQVMEKWNSLYWKEPSRNRYIFSDLSHYFIKNYGRNAINNAQPRKKVLDDLIHVYLDATKGLVPKLGMLYTNLKDGQLLLDLLLEYYNIGNLRNEVAHALPQEAKNTVDFDCLGEDETYEKVKKACVDFNSLLKKALSAAEGDKPYIIFDRTFQDYTRAHPVNNF